MRCAEYCSLWWEKYRYFYILPSQNIFKWNINTQEISWQKCRLQCDQNVPSNDRQKRTDFPIFNDNCKYSHCAEVWTDALWACTSNIRHTHTAALQSHKHSMINRILGVNFTLQNISKKSIEFVFTISNETDHTSEIEPKRSFNKTLKIEFKPFVPSVFEVVAHRSHVTQYMLCEKKKSAINWNSALLCALHDRSVCFLFRINFTNIIIRIFVWSLIFWRRNWRLTTSRLSSFFFTFICFVREWRTKRTKQFEYSSCVHCVALGTACTMVAFGALRTWWLDECAFFLSICELLRVRLKLVKMMICLGVAIFHLFDFDWMSTKSCNKTYTKTTCNSN